MIPLALLLISCSGAASQAEVVPTLDLPVEELNQQMFEAIRADDSEQLSLLITSGAQIEVEDPDTGATPLVIASYRGDAAVIQTLLSSGADVNGTNRAGITPLMGAAQSGHAALIPILLEAGADPEILSSSGYHQNALHFAAQKGHAEIVEALLNSGANVDALENTHSTALMYAAYGGHTEVVKILLEKGADTTILDNGGHTAAQWAERQGFPEIAQLIGTTE
jgi:ankyrin repeat protein